MSTKKDQRFVLNNINIHLPDVKTFPPDSFMYAGEEYTVLGESNKTDLIPVNFDSIEMAKIVTYGTINQYICSSKNGDLYDACIYKNSNNAVYLYGIRTRQLPDKPKKEKEVDKDE